MKASGNHMTVRVAPMTATATATGNGTEIVTYQNNVG